MYPKKVVNPAYAPSLAWWRWICYGRFF